MNQLLNHLELIAKNSPQRIVVKGLDSQLNANDLFSEIIQLSSFLLESEIHVLGLYADNSPSWVIVDLACQHANICLLPLPTFFSDQQLQFVIDSAGVDCLLANNPQRISNLFSDSNLVSETDPVRELSCWMFRNHKPGSIPPGTGKITFTSGSTGRPKGVCLSNDSIMSVAQSLVSKIDITGPQHLSILPYSMLLENLAGIYVPLLADGWISALPPEQTGIGGSSKLNPMTLLQLISTSQPDSMIIIPEILKVFILAMEHGWQAPSSLQFIAVGGGKVSPDLIHKARQSGLPVYEGYGLSECASVVSLNCFDDDRPGSVGKPLSHISITIDSDEIIVKDNSFLGYINEPESWGNNSIHTGDMGYFDERGFLFINGRKKNILISSFGRNIHPEWVESEVSKLPQISQCLIYGDEKPHLIALISSYGDSEEEQTGIANWLKSLNETLPDYAQIKAWHFLTEPFSKDEGLLTDNGRPKRANIYQKYKTEIENLYTPLYEESSK